MVDPNYGGIGYNYPGGAAARFEDKQDTFPPDQTLSMTAAGVLATCYTGSERPWLPKSIALLSEIPPSSRYADMYYWELGARAYVAATGTVAASWYAALVNAAAGCARPDGGMAACDAWGAEGGRIYATAMTVLALAAPFSEPPPSAKDAGTASAFLRKGSCEVSVAACVAERPTGIYADPGMRMKAVVRGTIQPWGGSPKVAGDGIKHNLKSYKPLLKGAPFGCLLGKIGPEGKLFRIENEKPFALNAHGQLFLIVNDDRPEDGSGAWTVRLQLER
jgi:hypothetical protein